MMTAINPHMENMSEVSGAFSCAYCACSSVEGIHGEAWRATLQQRHFVADPTKDSAAGPSTAIISTGKWRFSKLALVSCLASMRSCSSCVLLGLTLVSALFDCIKTSIKKQLESTKIKIKSINVLLTKFKKWQVDVDQKDLREEQLWVSSTAADAWFWSLLGCSGRSTRRHWGSNWLGWWGQGTRNTRCWSWNVIELVKMII